MARKFIDIMNELAEPLINECGCELVDSEYKKEGADMILRFYVEAKSGRVSLDELSEINTRLSDMIDEHDEIQNTFILEVSSPGVNRVLNKERDYLRYIGSTVDVSLFSALDNRKQFTAQLVGYDSGEKLFTLSAEGDVFNVEQNKVAKMNLHFEFGNIE